MYPWGTWTCTQGYMDSQRYNLLSWRHALLPRIRFDPRHIANEPYCAFLKRTLKFVFICKMNGKYCVRPSWHPRQPIRLPPALPKPRRNQASDSSHPRRDACKLLLLTPPQYRPQVPPQVGPMFTNLLTTKQTRHRHIYIYKTIT